MNNLKGKVNSQKVYYFSSNVSSFQRHHTSQNSIENQLNEAKNFWGVKSGNSIQEKISSVLEVSDHNIIDTFINLNIGVSPLYIIFTIP